MPRKIRAYPCEDCGAWTVRPRLSVDPHICAACGQRRKSEAQLRRWHGGIVYDPHRKPDPPEPKG